MQNTVFISIIFLFFIIGIFKGKKERNRFVSSIPNLVVSIGILGTFYGIFVGLMGFDETAISESIPTLLRGMKTAFLTSLCGMFCSIYLKGYYSYSDDKNIKISADPMQSLQKIEDAILTCFKSDQEYSLVSQVKLIRQEIIDGRRETKEAFKEFADNFAKMASESIVDQLQAVVDKFNVLLSDLVSESFKELTESTINLNEWQEKHKETITNNQNQLEKMFKHIQTLTASFETVITKLEKFDESFESIDESLTAISVSGTELDEHSKNITSQNQLLEASITAIRDMGKEAEKVVPEISSKINTLVNDVTSMQRSTTAFVSQTTQILEEGIKTIIENLKNESESVQKSTNDFITKATTDLQDNYKILNSSVNEHIESIDKSLEQELTKALNTLAGSLAALSSKFVSDYSPLTDRLSNLLTMVEGIDAIRPTN